jgi:hypothetical protein
VWTISQTGWKIKKFLKTYFTILSGLYQITPPYSGRRWQFLRGSDLKHTGINFDKPIVHRKDIRDSQVSLGRMDAGKEPDVNAIHLQKLQPNVTALAKLG